MAHKWEALNAPESILPKDGINSPFTITTQPKTDIWRIKTANVFTGPAIGTSMPLKSLSSFSATVSGPWKTQFDQGGIVLVFSKSPNAELAESSWIKAGIEYYEGKPKIGIVCTDRYSDWSVCPEFEPSGKLRLTAEVVGDVLYIYAVMGQRRDLLREVHWVAGLGEETDASLWVGVYAAKPTPEKTDESATLEVSFEDVELKTC